MSGRRILGVAFGALMLGLVAWFVIDFPVGRAWLALGFLFYATLLWRWPVIWLYAVPALLPIFDLAQWSGRFFFDEFDALVLLTVGVLALREPSPGSPLSRRTKLVLVLLGISYLISALRFAWPLPSITPDSFANYYSPYNALRIGKGFLWAVLLLAPLRQASTRGVDVRLLLCRGLLIGLAGVALASVYERWLFTGVLTYVTTYRTTATFSSMHTGSGHIDVYLATTIPLLGILLIDRRWLKLLPLALAFTLLSLYALLVTQSRGPVVAVVAAFGIGILTFLLTRQSRRKALVAIAGSLAAMALFVAAGLVLFSQTSIAQRFSQSRPDALYRVKHWEAALLMRDHTLETELFGMGLGSFPVTHQLRSTFQAHAARYQFVASPQESLLRLWSGEDIYFEQDVRATQNTLYRLRLEARTSEPHAVISVAWCELWLLSSENCTLDRFILSPRPAAWQSFAKVINTKLVGSGRHIGGIFIEKPTKLTFFVEGSDRGAVDLGNISLTDMQGHELIQNGSFVAGGDHWFWADDFHWPWHTENLAVNILFDQGWLGLIGVGALLLLVIAVLMKGLVEGDALAAVLLASLTGFLVTGITVSTFDQPRLALMFYLLCLSILVHRVNRNREPARGAGLS